MAPSPVNPYQPPTAPLELPLAPNVGALDASRGDRLLAATIDGVLSSIAIIPLQLWAGTFDDFPNMKEGSLLESVGWSLLGAFAWVALHGVFLARSAQTIGKKLLDIQVVNVSDGRPAPLGKLVFVRYLPTIFVAAIPIAGTLLSFVNVLFIFRPDRRCIHDHIAQTRVIALRPRAQS